MILLIVIVNYRVADLVIDCLHSLEAEVAALGGTRVVVTDNASEDDSVARLTAAVHENGWDGWVSIKALGRNGGFSFGNNAAIGPALQESDPPQYVLLLNPDTLVRPGALKALVAFMESRPDVGLAGSRLEELDGTAQTSAFRFPSVLSELEAGMRFKPVSRLLARWMIAPPIPEGPCPTDWVSGACLIIRRAVFGSVGLLDEGYFMYCEEVDFCRRAHRAGWPCWYVPQARVVHLVGRSSGTARTGGKRKRLPEYWFRSRRRYFLTHHGRFKTLLADLVWSAAYSSFRLRRIIQRKPDTDPRLFLWDFLRYNFFPVR